MNWLHRWTKSLFKSNPSRRARLRFRPQLELLEDRLVPTAPPVAVNDAYVTDENAPLFINAAAGVLANDSDPNLGSLTITEHSNPTHTQFFQLNGDGSFTYVPTLGFHGTDGFSYTIANGLGDSATASVTFTVNYLDLTPWTNADYYEGVAGTALNVAAGKGVLHNDFDLDFDPLTASIDPNKLPAHGSVVLNSDGSFSYTADEGYKGTDSFQYLATDDYGNSAGSTVYLSVSPAANVFLVTTTDDGPGIDLQHRAGTLRWAIDQANDNPGSSIQFDIGDPGSAQTIFVHGLSLPTITANTMVDGWSQGGSDYRGAPLITLDGDQGNEMTGLYFDVGSDNSTVRGLTIQNFHSEVPGTSDGDGIDITPGSPNLNIWVYGNRILNNDGYGLFIGGGADGNTIGSNGDGANDASEGNVISGNGIAGIYLNSDGNAIADNVITGNGFNLPTDSIGFVPSTGSGLWITGMNDTVRGNVISGNDGPGLWIASSGDTIQGNFIGTDATGSQQLGNYGPGILLNIFANNNLIGGTQAGQGNVIAANVSGGIVFMSSSFAGSSVNNNTVAGNWIGTNAEGAANLGNRQHGVLFTGNAHDNNLTGNVIADNQWNGVTVIGNQAIGDRISANSIFANGGFAIDLNGDGFSGNDAGDTDGGPNLMQNFPVLSSVTLNNGSTTIAGTLNSTANTTFQVEFFSNPTNAIQGKTYLGSVSVTTDATGNASFNAALAVAIPRHSFVTATATDPAGNTSEFSVALMQNNPPKVINETYQFDNDMTVALPAVSGLLANDSDPDGDPIQIAGMTAPLHAASFTLFFDGSFSYTPVAGFHGTDSFTYRVSDTLSSQSATWGTVTFNVKQAPPPVATIEGPALGVPGQTLTFVLSSSKPTTTYKIDWDGNGTVDQTVTGSGPVTVTHVFTTKANYNVRVTPSSVAGTGAVVSRPIVISSANLQADPDDSTKIALFIGGTTSNDTIIVAPATLGGVNVTYNNANLGRFVPTGHIIVFGQAGDDTISIDTKITLGTILDGGSGNDKLYGRLGRDLLIGGLGQDILYGRPTTPLPTDAPDLVIGGSTIYDSNLPALCQILASWKLNNGTLPSELQAASAILDDGVADQLWKIRAGFDLGVLGKLDVLK